MTALGAPEVTRYLENLVARCSDLLGERLLAVWVVGSLATGDFALETSDVDVMLVTDGAIDGARKERLATDLRHEAFPCPAHGLDLIAFREAEVRTPARIPTFEFSISTGVDWEDDVASGGPYPGALLDLAVAKARGLSALGPRPSDVVGYVPSGWVAEELVAALRWHEDRIHDPFHDPTGGNAVLNACRAACWATTGTVVSKGAGARWLLESGAGPGPLHGLDGVLAAAAMEDRRLRLPADRVRSFLGGALAVLRDARVSA